MKTFGSLFAGVGGFDKGFENAGFECLWQVEYDRACRSVLERHWPGVDRSVTDVTLANRTNLKPVDIIVGGFPCQDVSVAGARAGLDGERSGLWFQALRIIEELQPKMVVIENVPGLISSNGGEDLRTVLDGLVKASYAITGLDILDSQNFGVAQQRERIFICAHRTDDLLNQKTIFSALIIAQCLMEILADTLGVLRGQLATDCENYNSKSGKCEHSLRQKMILFGLQKENQVSRLLDSLAVLQQLCAHEAVGLESNHGKSSAAASRTSRVTGSIVSEKKATSIVGSTSTGPSWRTRLAAALRIARECITSTSSNKTTDQRIFTCAQATLSIAAFMQGSAVSSPSFSTAASSSLTTLQEFTAYARLTSNDLFAAMDWNSRWSDFVTEAERSCEVICGIGVQCSGEVFSLSESGGWHPQTSREKRQDLAARSETGAGTGGGYELSPPITAGGRGTERCGESRGQDCVIPVVSHTLRAESDASEGGTVVLGPTEPVASTLRSGSSTEQGHRARSGDKDENLVPVGIDGSEVGFALRSNASHSGDKGDGGVNTTMVVTGPLMASGAGAERPAGNYNKSDFCNATEQGDRTAALNCASDPNQQIVRQNMGVRRLMPVECERLQGFPDGHTEPQADSPRYKQLGNAVTVSVAYWIGTRIIEIEP